MLNTMGDPVTVEFKNNLKMDSNNVAFYSNKKYKGFKFREFYRLKSEIDKNHIIPIDNDWFNEMIINLK